MYYKRSCAEVFWYIPILHTLSKHLQGMDGRRRIEANLAYILYRLYTPVRTFIRVNVYNSSIPINIYVCVKYKCEAPRRRWGSWVFIPYSLSRQNQDRVSRNSQFCARASNDETCASSSRLKHSFHFHRFLFIHCYLFIFIN